MFPTPESTGITLLLNPILTSFNYMVKPAEQNEGQHHTPIVVHLERAPQDIVRYLPDKVRFFSEVVWGHEEVPVV